MGLPCVTQVHQEQMNLNICSYSLNPFQGGQYVLDIMDTYGASISVLIMAIMEMTFIMWAYGVNNFCKDVYSMLDFTPSIYFKVTGTIIESSHVIFRRAGLSSPLQSLSLFSLPLQRAGKNPATAKSNIQVPRVSPLLPGGECTALTTFCSDWLHGIGWALTLLSVVQIPLWMVVTTVAAALQGDVMEAFRPSLVWIRSLYFYFLVNFSLLKYLTGVDGETGAEGLDYGDEHLLTRQQPGPDDWEK